MNIASAIFLSKMIDRRILGIQFADMPMRMMFVIRCCFSGEGRTIEKFHLWVKEKVTTTYVASGWIAVQRFFRNMGWNMTGPSRAGIYWKLTLFWPNPDTPLR